MNKKEFYNLKEGDLVYVVRSIKEYKRLTKGYVSVEKNSEYSRIISSILGKIIPAENFSSAGAVIYKDGWQIYRQALTKVTLETHPEYFL